ncbi:threonine dehydratase [Xylanimonas cellulosilytica DSM 15894]|uniref:threonine ammonia-lyase n=1 Tax=Xylanimonas cellulosilytica (strain DSM 15894 / JCM 12276 / CECT 5975 / KCTC 9989 / LMG 20990 / NBRC 107835 / XIL07) TaxID=446471 RepID=D1BX82_XYLCX|nr:threonine ammonia-lyase [Xylanimonas cellulosilytica]ACZ31650.1 threonine dehydratase [Xylanimonas cellulosilytica DSM 15894]
MSGPVVTLADVRRAAALLDGVAIRTPVQPFRALAEAAGVPVMLKLENLQRAGSFKVRGAYTRIAGLAEAERAAGVVAASAGNHAQGVALAAQLLGIDAVVYMPVDAPLPKLAATRGYGADVRLVGTSVDEALVEARADAARTGRVLIHPFDHPDVVAGQGTVALEILEQVPDVRTILVPLGGGGLVAGIATVLAEAAPHVRVVGVQAEIAAAYPRSIAAGHPVPGRLGPTMADGIAVGTPGDVPFEILDRLGVEVRTVSEESLSRALLLVAERAKLVVEPSGAAGVAALMDDPSGLEGTVVPLLTGGNIDPLLLMRVIQHGMVAAGRYLHLRVRVDDRPGALATLVQTVAAAGGNIIHVEHTHTDTTLGVFDVMVALQVEAKGPDHCAQIVDHLREAGFEIR